MTIQEHHETRRAERARSRIPIAFAMIAAVIALVFVIGFTLKAIF